MVGTNIIFNTFKIDKYDRRAEEWLNNPGATAGCQQCFLRGTAGQASSGTKAQSRLLNSNRRNVSTLENGIRQ